MEEIKKIATRESFGKAISELKDENIVVLDADLSSATKTDLFQRENPDRFIEVGISESDMMGTAAGLATCGKIPFASTFAVFATGRCYDQIRSSIAYPKLNVKICGTHAGVTVGEDGATHQMLEDINLMRGLPNMVVVSPSDDVQTKALVKEIAKYEGPVYLRLARVETPVIYANDVEFEIGKAIQLGEGIDATVFSTGVTVAEALKAQEELLKEGVDIRVVDVHTIKPIDKEMIVKCAKETSILLSVEDHNVIGGLGTAIADVLAEEYPKKLIKLGINDCFGKSGKAENLMEYFKIDSKSIEETIKEKLYISNKLK